MTDDERRQKLVHDRRGAFQSIRLSTEIVAREPNPRDAIPWLELIEKAADDWVRFSDQLDSLRQIEPR
jgi:hypothetical protein